MLWGVCVAAPLIIGGHVAAQETAPPPTPPLPGGTTPTGKIGANLDAPSLAPIRPAQDGPQTPAAAAADAKNDRLLDIKADKTRELFADGVQIAEGHVRIVNRGYIVTSDRATYEPKKRLVTLQSNVVLQTAAQTVYADNVTLDLRTGEFTTREGRTVLTPDQVGGNLLEPLRVSGQTYERQGKKYIATQGFLTTCDFPFPHYKIGFSRATVIPNDRVILRDAVIYRYDKAVLRLGYLVVPIRDDVQRSSPILFGKTQEEGYFAKAAIGYVLRDYLPGQVRIDLMEKKGVGLGVNQLYKFAETAAGSVYLYNLNDRNRHVQNFNGRLNHSQRIDETSSLTVASDFQNNSYNAISPSSKTQATTITTTRNANNGTTNTTLGLNTSDYSTSSSRNVTYEIGQNQRFGPVSSVNFRLRGSESDNISRSLATSTVAATRTASGRIEQNGDIQARSQISVFDLDLAANRLLTSHTTGTGGGQNFYSGLERLPELTVGTDTQRLHGSPNIPVRFALGLGKFLERSNNITTRRALFLSDATPRPVALTRGGALSLSLPSSFRQSVYGSGDAAQYVLTSSPQLTQRLSAQSSLNFGYNYIRPYGGTPLNFTQDQVGSTNRLNSILSAQSYRTRLTLQTGYDLQRARGKTLSPGQKKNPWDNLATQLSLRPSNVFQTAFNTAYDINSGRLQTVNNRMRVRTQQGFALNTGTTYDPTTKKFPQITETLQMPLFGRDLTLSLLTGYNGITKKFDYKTLGLVQSFHDYEYVFGYREQPYGYAIGGQGARADRGFTFTIRLKAFPVAVSQSTGQYGAALDTGTGEIF